MLPVGGAGKETPSLEHEGDAEYRGEQPVAPENAGDYFRIVRKCGTEYGLEETKDEADKQEDDQDRTEIAAFVSCPPTAATIGVRGGIQADRDQIEANRPEKAGASTVPVDLPLRGCRRADGRGHFAAPSLGDDVETLQQAFGKTLFTECGNVILVDDALAQGVGERAFQPVANFDARFALVRRDEDQYAVVLAFFPNLPFFESGDGSFLDGGFLQVGHNVDGGPDIVGYAQGPDAVTQRLPVGLAEQPGIVEHVALEGRRLKRQGRLPDE